jgi:hypothetical protein
MKWLILIGFAGVATASGLAYPYFEIETVQDWRMSLEGGSVVPVDQAQWDEYMMHWQTGEVIGDPYPMSDFWLAQLYLYDGGQPPYPTDGGLVMAWGDQPMSDLNSSAWAYQYGSDPDLSSALVTLTAFAPPGITKVSFGVRDANGNDRAWYWNVGVNPGFPNGVYVTVTIDLSQTGLAATNPPADAYLNTPGFDITQAMTFLLDETFHIGMTPTPIPPPAGPAMALWWNAWRDLKVENRLRYKWRQPPDPAFPGNVYYGWNELSDWWYGPVVADDWVCQVNTPVTDVHWWGSFLGWKHPDPPPLPTHFHIQFWTDVPADPNDPTSFSHPGQVIHEIFCYNYTWHFDGWDFDPRMGLYEACFKFEQILDPSEYFIQAAGTNIYWISIAACYDGMPPPIPWGWKTRPRDPNSPAPDDAVIIFDPVQPMLGDFYINGMPIEWPQGRSWDMAFELTSEALKWDQPPDPTLPGLHAHDWMVPGAILMQELADDWECMGGDVVGFDWWGNYELDAAGNEMRGAGINHFLLSVSMCAPGPSGFCVPMEPPIWTAIVPFTATLEQPTGLVNNEGSPIYLYDFDLSAGPFLQDPGNFYWLRLVAIANDPQNPPLWRWQEANRTPAFLGHAPGAARTPPQPWDSITWPNGEFSDFAFVVDSDFGMNVKWSQPPMQWVPDDAYNGWDEFSIQCDMQVAADDWVCSTNLPVTDIHWWGSFIGWYEPFPPPDMPIGFVLGIWTDVPGGPGGNFSHPEDCIWVNFCDTYTWEFVGWDFDPRNPLAPPEATFKFTQILPAADAFVQGPGTNIYWLSISAEYAGVVPMHPFGWKTRPRSPNSPAPDAAVRIFDPTCVVVGASWMNGEPIWMPTPQDWWDLAFELTTPAGPVWCLGDSDCSTGTPTFPDIPYFVAALAGEANWVAHHLAHAGSPPVCPYLINDMNGYLPGGTPGVEFTDIPHLVTALTQPCIVYPY